MRRACRIGVFVGVLALLATPLRVGAQAATSDAPAAVAANEGDAAFAAGRYDEALAKFQTALQQSQAPEILFRLGQTYAKLGRKVEALDHFERFLAAGAKADARMQKEARAQAQALVTQVGEITVRARDGTPVSVDGREVGKTPLAPFRVAAGIRKVALGGYEETVRVGGGGHVTVSPPPEPDDAHAPMLAVTPTAAPADTSATPAQPVDAAPAAESDSLTGKWWFWTGIAVVTVGAAVGIAIATGGEEAAPPLAAKDGSLSPVRAEW